MQARYALRSTADIEAGTVWSTGSYWDSQVPAEDKLLTGPQIDELAKRHPQAQIVDVIVHRAACAVWTKTFNAAIAALGGRRSTHEERQAARAKADAAVKAQGYVFS